MMSPLAVVPEDAAAWLAARDVLDVRDDATFASGHLPGSGHVPGHAFAERRAELPPREQPLLVVAADGARAHDAALELGKLGFLDVRWLDGPPHAVPGAILVSEPAVPLWRPNPFLAEVLPLLPPAGRALDLASGSGRDAVFLGLHGFRVEAWDFDLAALARAQALAIRNGVALGTMICDLEQPDPPLPERAWDVIVCFRFLHRPLLPRLARALAPGGHLVYETYRRGQQRFGKPQRGRFLLEPGELRSAFPELEVLRYDEPSPPGGPWTARLLARRPGGSQSSAGANRA